ncbi:MAG: hypothetical protein LBS60_11170 [Deltaproteobacteria bacterium]|jgi:hypothetical protein|nr:hypothetical protein [Deltaproteobacteria bacterium]
MYNLYKESGLTTKRSYFIIPLFSLILFTLLSFPLSYIFITINIKYKVTSVVWFFIALVVGLIFSYITNWSVLISRCRNKKLAIILIIIGLTFGYYVFICLLFTLSTNFEAYKSITVNYDIFITVFRFIDVFLPIMFGSDIGTLIAVKVIISYVIIVITVVLSNLFLSKNYYSEKNNQWMKCKIFTKEFYLKNNIESSIKNKEFLNIDKLFNLFNTTNKNNNSKTIFTAFYSKDLSELILSATLSYQVDGVKRSVELFNEIFLTGFEAKKVLKNLQS